MDNLIEREQIVPAIYGRCKGAEWFDTMYKKDVIIIGQGGIGSWLTLIISRIGVNLFTYDFDRFESHNGGQFMNKHDVGELKTEALKKSIALYSPDCQIHTSGAYGWESETGNIVLCGLDKMTPRKQAFKNWRRYVSSLPEEIRKTCFFQDGRLLAEQLQIFSIAGNREDKMQEYEQYHLHDDEDVPDASCTNSQTTYCASMIASHMVEFLCNWAANLESKSACRAVPFMYEYLAPVHVATSVY